MNNKIESELPSSSKPVESRPQQRSMRPRTFLYQQRVKFIENRLKDNFPHNYVFFHAALLIFSGILGILLQVALIINEEPMYEYGQGVWAGTACLMIAVSALLLEQQKTYRTYALCTCFHTLGFMVIFAGYILINSLKLSEATINNELMIFIGIMAGFLCLVFPIRMSISVFGVNQKHFKAYSESISKPAPKNPDIEDIEVKKEELSVIEEDEEKPEKINTTEQIA